MQVLTTVLTLDHEHPATRAMMADAHVAHRLTMSGFAHLLQQHDFFTGVAHGHADHRRSLNILFAVSVRPNDAIMVRIQSDKPPDFTQRACDSWRAAIIGAQPPVTRSWSVPVSGHIRYQIRANPTINTNGRRRAINGFSRQFDWWTTKAESAGLVLRPATLTIDEPLTLEFPSKYQASSVGGGRWVMPTQRYSGAATIVDQVAYRQAVGRGIGRGLAYGAGLLLTMRAS
ncbi:type I-E CRISPR-associated protein Cas6/Cse3/CasE [Mycobacterium hodleri]|uniref:type I-E CRISPR-associated protein Cas6/Cse3/CasE n=1 Tax=Mycolicibacterium hodleri TaxID=49897 RepID=UPI0021F35EF0|nr:type I-E CRISPR-associated protein Cas6/Cse3/CasE [Mycolicibacterium hodleri]MCV7133202.1 type I-E CRISPR-associated protein Cas6/Cse3/CasE [Mycolicibacterium hodleri]